MKKSKRIFLGFAAVFFIVMIILGYDISRRTTFPGSKKLKTETVSPSDTTKADTTKIHKDK